MGSPPIQTKNKASDLEIAGPTPDSFYSVIKSEKKSPDIGARKDSILTGIRADSITTGIRAESGIESRKNSIMTVINAESITTGIRAESGMTMKKTDSIFAGESDIRTKTTASEIQEVGLTEKRLKEFNSNQK